MAEGVPDAGTVDAGGGVAAPDAAPTDAQQRDVSTDIDSGDFDGRLRSDPDFYVGQYKAVQRKQNQDHSKLVSAKLAIEIAEALGNGDVEAGAQTALQQLQTYQAAQQNPAMQRILDHFSQTGQVPVNGDLGADVSDDDYVDPAVKALQDQVASLSQTVTGLSGQTAEQSFKGALDTYFTEGDGQWLEPEERKSLFTDIETRVKNAGRPLTSAEVELLSTEYLRRNKLVAMIGERMHLQKLRKRGDLATDVPSSVGPSGVNDLLDPSAFKEKTASEALAYARNKFGG